MDTYEEIVHKYSQNVYAVALMMVNDPSAAGDIVQDVFIRIYKGLGTFEGRSRISTWIFRITKNVCYDYFRSLKKIPDELPDNTVAIPDHDSNPENEYEKTWQNKMVRRAVIKLPADQRMALSMFYFTNSSYREIARAMDLPEGTVKSHIHRGKKGLKIILQPLLEE